MIISGRIWDISDVAWLALTPTERWAAARRMHPTFVSEYGFIVLAGLILLLLTVLLWWVSFGRKAQQVDVPRELFSEHATRRRLSARQRQILLAVVARSGLKHNHQVFTKADAFDRGAKQLLAECVANRTPEENERLKAEVARLGEKLGFRLVLNHNEKIGFAHQRHFPRVSVNGAALVASFPLLGDASIAVDTGTSFLEAPTFVEGVMVELAGPDLQVQAELDVQPGDRVLVVFNPVTTPPLGQEDGTPPGGRVIQSVGEVKHCREAVDGRVVALELTGLSDSEIDELMAIVDAASRPDAERPAAPNVGPDERADPQPAANSGIVQGA